MHIGKNNQYYRIVCKDARRDRQVIFPGAYSQEAAEMKAANLNLIPEWGIFYKDFVAEPCTLKEVREYEAKCRNSQAIWMAHYNALPEREPEPHTEKYRSRAIIQEQFGAIDFPDDCRTYQEPGRSYTKQLLAVVGLLICGCLVSIGTVFYVASQIR